MVKQPMVKQLKVWQKAHQSTAAIAIGSASELEQAQASRGAIAARDRAQRDAGRARSKAGCRPPERARRSVFGWTTARSTASLVAERLDGVDASGAAGGKIRRGERDSEERQRPAREGGGIRGVDTVQQARDGSRRGER